MLEQNGTIYERVQEKQQETAKDFVSKSKAELLNKKRELENQLSLDGRKLDAKQYCELQEQREDIIIELFCRTKGKEAQSYRHAYYEGDLVRRRAEKYNEWAKQMEAKFGNEWKGKVSESEWKQWLEFSPEEITAYQKYLEIRKQAGLPNDKIYEKMLHHFGLLKDGKFIPLEEENNYTNLRREIKKAFPQVPEKILNKAMKEIEFLVFELTASFEVLFVLIKDIKSDKASTANGREDQKSQQKASGDLFQEKFKEQVKRGTEVIKGILLRMNIRVAEQKADTKQPDETSNKKKQNLLTKIKNTCIHPTQMPNSQKFMVQSVY